MNDIIEYSDNGKVKISYCEYFDGRTDLPPIRIRYCRRYTCPFNISKEIACYGSAEVDWIDYIKYKNRGSDI